jgi:hypothetical protein
MTEGTGITLMDEERQPCEVWTRVMGYHRPVSEFNPGKQSEHSERRYFREAVEQRELACVARPPLIPMGAQKRLSSAQASRGVTAATTIGMSHDVVGGEPTV